MLANSKARLERQMASAIDLIRTAAPRIWSTSSRGRSTDRHSWSRASPRS
jgi:hypothetical protein